MTFCFAKIGDVNLFLQFSVKSQFWLSIKRPQNAPNILQVDSLYSNINPFPYPPALCAAPERLRFMFQHTFRKVKALILDEVLLRSCFLDYLFFRWGGRLLYELVELLCLFQESQLWWDVFSHPSQARSSLQLETRFLPFFLCPLGPS